MLRRKQTNKAPYGSLPPCLQLTVSYPKTEVLSCVKSVYFIYPHSFYKKMWSWRIWSGNHVGHDADTLCREHLVKKFLSNICQDWIWVFYVPAFSQFLFCKLKMTKVVLSKSVGWLVCLPTEHVAQGFEGFSDTLGKMRNKDETVVCSEHWIKGEWHISLKSSFSSIFFRHIYIAMQLTVTCLLSQRHHNH